MAEYGSFGSGLAGGYLTSSKQRHEQEALQAKTDTAQAKLQVERSTAMMGKTLEVMKAYRTAIARTQDPAEKQRLQQQFDGVKQAAEVLNNQLKIGTKGSIDFSSAIAAGGEQALAEPNLDTRVVNGQVIQLDLNNPDAKAKILYTSDVRDKPPIEVLQEAAAAATPGSKEYQQIQDQIAKLGATTAVALSELGKAIKEQSAFTADSAEYQFYADKIKKITSDTGTVTPTDLSKLLEEQKAHKPGSPEHKLYQDKINILTTRKPTDPKIAPLKPKWVMVDGKPHKQNMRLAKPGEQGDEMGLVPYGDLVPMTSSELGWIAKMMQERGGLGGSLLDQNPPTATTPTATTPTTATPATGDASGVDVNQIVSDATETAGAVASPTEPVNPDQRIQQAKVSALFGMGMNGWSNEQIADRLSEGEFTETEITEILEYAMANLAMEPHPDLGLSFYEKIQWRDRNRKK